MSFAACGETNDMELATTRCIIAPLSPSRVFALVRFLRFSPVLNQQVQLLLNRFALEDEGQQLHHILIGQNGRLFQKGLQHSGTGAKPMGSLASGQPFQLALQSLLLVLSCGQFLLCNILFVFQLFKFFADRQLLLSDNGQNKSDQLFTVDRLCIECVLSKGELHFPHKSHKIDVLHSVFFTYIWYLGSCAWIIASRFFRHDNTRFLLR